MNLFKTKEPDGYVNADDISYLFYSRSLNSVVAVLKNRDKVILCGNMEYYKKELTTVTHTSPGMFYYYAAKEEKEPVNDYPNLEPKYNALPT